MEIQDLLFGDKDFDRPFSPDADRLRLARDFIDELVRQVQTDGFWKDPKLNELVGWPDSSLILNMKLLIKLILAQTTP